MKVIDGMPRPSNTKSNISSTALQERDIKMVLYVQRRRAQLQKVHWFECSRGENRACVICGYRVFLTFLVFCCRVFRLSVMAYAQPHPRPSVLSSVSQSSIDHLSSTGSTRFSLPSVPSTNTAATVNKQNPPRPSIYDRNLNKTRVSEVSAPAFAFLFSEIVQYTQKRVNGINDLERR